MSPSRSDQEQRVNERIRVPEVRLVDPEGQQLGVVRVADALAMARKLDLDLVEVAPDARPPVAKIMNYGRHRFEAAVRAKESKRKSTRSELKEMRYSVRIGPGDFETKTRKVNHFLQQGHKVKVIVRFRRGREMLYTRFGRDLLNRVAEQVDNARIESAPRLDGTMMTMLLAPTTRST